MDEDKLEEWLKKAIIDRFDAGELVDFLGIAVEEIVEVFEGEILEHIDDVQEYMQVMEDNEAWDD